jgi:hypothetical protein
VKQNEKPTDFRLVVYRLLNCIFHYLIKEIIMAYNGWTNYATWRINLEMFDGGEWRDCTYEDFKQMAHESIEQDASGLALDYALAFLYDVNWYEIAEHYQEEEYTSEEIALQASIEEKTERMM